ncbi:MAG TPA: hypothetical protein VF476_00755 [Chitinophagaceae bacterium]
MKQFFLFLLSGLCVNMYATVRTVSNNPATLGQFSTIQAAIDASSNGDTVYVQGSPVRYAGFTIQDKRLTIIGPGWYPTQNFQPFKATIEGNVAINGMGSSKSELQGLDFFYTFSINTSNPDSLRFIRNQFETAFYLGSAGTYKGYLFEGNWFDHSWLSASAGVHIHNFLFQNNIFYAVSTNGNFFGFVNTLNIYFDHNLWYGPSGTNTAPCFGSASKGMNFSNNIFVHRNVATNNTLSIFNNNITYAAGVNDPWDATYSNSDAGGNIVNQDPQMVSQSSVNNGLNLPLLNFTIASGPANNAGSDGKDMGLLFNTTGTLNWSNSNMSRLPVMVGMNIFNPVISAGDTLRAQVDGRRNN